MFTVETVRAVCLLWTFAWLALACCGQSLAGWGIIGGVSSYCMRPACAFLADLWPAPLKSHQSPGTVNVSLLSTQQSWVCFLLWWPWYGAAVSGFKYLMQIIVLAMYMQLNRRVLTQTSWSRLKDILLSSASKRQRLSMLLLLKKENRYAFSLRLVSIKLALLLQQDTSIKAE